MEITCVTIDCEPERSPLERGPRLGWRRSRRRIGAICGPPGAASTSSSCGFRSRRRSRTVYIGCSAGTLADLDATIDRLSGLGGTIVGGGFPPEYACTATSSCDVEGNEFV